LNARFVREFCAGEGAVLIETKIVDRPNIPADDILQGMNEWLNVRSTFKAVLDESDGERYT
jgi:hypothetical protein